MYVFGGKDNDDEKLNDLWRFDLETEVWEEIIAAPGSQKPIGRYGHSSATYNGHLIVFGGIHEITKELNDLYIFNFQTNQWRRLFKS
jgi:N-acetylneuraminic acid mutarotase